MVGAIGPLAPSPQPTITKINPPSPASIPNFLIIVKDILSKLVFEVNDGAITAATKVGIDVKVDSRIQNLNRTVAEQCIDYFACVQAAWKTEGDQSRTELFGRGISMHGTGRRRRRQSRR